VDIIKSAREYLLQQGEPCGNDACIGADAREMIVALIGEVERLRPEQPMPVPGKQDVRPMAEKMFAQILDAQCAKGVERYGTVLQTFNGRDALMDALAELVDAFQYIVQGVIEREEAKGLASSREEEAG